MKIPIELLRRSTRICVSRKECTAQESNDAKKRHVSLSEETTLACKKRIKTGQVKREDVNISTIEDQDKVKTYPEPDGVLQIDCDELDLERTLLGGQSFRWTKSHLESRPIFTGVIRDKILQLWRISPETIAFKSLNIAKTNISQHEIQCELKEILRDYFQLRYNLKELYMEWSSKDKHLGECCKELKGFRILRQDPVENVFSFICATNNNIKRITQMVDNLCRRFGPILDTKSDNSVNSDRSKANRMKVSIYDCFHSFPSVERLAEPDVFDCLRHELGFGYRAKFVTETARQLIELGQKNSMKPRDYLLSLRLLPYKETCKKLMQFQGIGRKVADCICLMSMDHLESVPIDCHIYDIVCRHYMPRLKQERKSLTEGVHDLIGDYFKSLHGSLAGWSTSVLFIGELRHIKAGSGAKNKDDLASIAANAVDTKPNPDERKSVKHKNRKTKQWDT